MEADHQSADTLAELDHAHLKNMSRSEPNINRKLHGRPSEAALGHAQSMTSVQLGPKSPKPEQESTIFHGVTYLGQ